MRIKEPGTGGWTITGEVVRLVETRWTNSPNYHHGGGATKTFLLRDKETLESRGNTGFFQFPDNTPIMSKALGA